MHSLLSSQDGRRRTLGYIGLVLLLLIIPVKLLRYGSAAGQVLVGVAPSLLGPSGLLFIHPALQSGKSVAAHGDAAGYPGGDGVRWSRNGAAGAAPGHPRKSALHIRCSGSGRHGCVGQRGGADCGAGAAWRRKSEISRAQDVRSITTACSRRRRGRHCLLQRTRGAAAADAGR